MGNNALSFQGSCKEKGRSSSVIPIKLTAFFYVAGIPEAEETANNELSGTTKPERVKRFSGGGRME
ncbi:hypothetical protein YC2023_058309 [Brassica napus]